MTDREFLRLHVEAVWGISVPPLEGDTVELTDTTPLPPWTLYQADLLQGERITIWRPSVTPEEQADLLQHAQSAGVVFDAAVGMRREVVLRFPDAPTLSAEHDADLITAEDTALLEAFEAARLVVLGADGELAGDDTVLLQAFEAGSASYYMDPTRAPCIGVIVAGMNVGGRLECVAHSSRRTADACELGVKTLPEARRQGNATAATFAWTRAIQQEGLTPIYSAFAHNIASLRLAAAAGYVQVSASVYGPVSETHE